MKNTNPTKPLGWKVTLFMAFLVQHRRDTWTGIIQHGLMNLATCIFLIRGACEKSALLQCPRKEDIRITVFDVVEPHVQHLVDHIKDIRTIRQAHNVETHY